MHYSPLALHHAWPISARWPARLTATLCLLAALLGGCALDPLHQVRPGSTAEHVRGVMGEPWSQWSEPDGIMHWSYPTGPLGRHTYEVQFDAAGTVRSVEDVLSDRGFARIEAGKTTELEVQRLFGPPYRVIRFERKRETAWDYRFRDTWTYPAIFSVIFNDTGIVTMTMQQREFYGHDDPMN